MNEIRTEEEFLANQHDGAVIAITDTATGNRVHVLPCNYVKADYFRMKVIAGRNVNGRYYLCDSVEEAERRYGARRCTCAGSPTRLPSHIGPKLAAPLTNLSAAATTPLDAAVISYFSSSDVLKASLAMGPLDTGVLLSPAELSRQLSQRGLGAFPANAIFQGISSGRLDVRADAGRGKQNRLVPIVEWGADCIGLNTEANCREVLARTLRARGFATVFEFVDDPETARCVAIDEEPILQVRTAANQRDLLAIRDDPGQRLVWAVETKGHSGLESWDFWELFGQLSRLEEWASFVRQAASSLGRTVLVSVAIAVPDRRCQVPGTCYAQELSRLRGYLDEPEKVLQITHKTLARFVDWWVRWGKTAPAGNRGPNVMLVRGIGEVVGAPP
ncbi:MAG: hypothetical protein LAO51_01520 [Acidobacteriia bacterium]|nr:hypothetical protein [Terriglobia bacterium]